MADVKVKIRADTRWAKAWMFATAWLGFVIGWDRATRVMDFGVRRLIRVQLDGGRWHRVPPSFYDRAARDT